MLDAGWDLTAGVSVEDSLHALTGYAAQSWKSSAPDDANKDNFGQKVLEPLKDYPTVLVTKPEKEHSVEGLKPNYSYLIVQVQQDKKT